MKHALIVIFLIITVVTALAAAVVGTTGDRTRNWNFWVALALTFFFATFLVRAW